MILGRTGVVTGGGEMTVSSEVVVGVYLKALVYAIVKRDSLRSHGFQILDKVDKSVAVGRLGILGEAGASMCYVCNISTGALLQGIEIHYHFPII